jgi:hypothetical protein
MYSVVALKPGRIKPKTLLAKNDGQAFEIHVGRA